MSRPARRTTALTGLLLTAALAGGCAGGDGAAGDGDATTLTVFAASSLTSTFQTLADTFEEQHDGVEVELSFGGSTDLVAKVQQGAPADVLASADEATMDRLVADDLTAAPPRLFASNTLEIAVPPGNPADVAGLADLADDGLNLVVCAPEVPCGAATTTLTEAAGVTLSPVSEEQSVTDVLAKVRTGEADAGIVYVTDVQAAGDDVEGIEVPEADAAVNLYPIAPVAVAGGSEAQAALAREFVDLVLSDEGRQVLRDAGFAPAP